MEKRFYSRAIKIFFVRSERNRIGTISQDTTFKQFSQIFQFFLTKICFCRKNLHTPMVWLHFQQWVTRVVRTCVAGTEVRAPVKNTRTKRSSTKIEFSIGQKCFKSESRAKKPVYSLPSQLLGQTMSVETKGPAVASSSNLFYHF